MVKHLTQSLGQNMHTKKAQIETYFVYVISISFWAVDYCVLCLMLRAIIKQTISKFMINALTFGNVEYLMASMKGNSG